MTEIKTNFKNKYDEYNCVACEKKNEFHEETQEHIYLCKNINENKGIFSNIFDNKQETKFMKEITIDYLANMKQRRKLLPERRKNCHRCGPCGEVFSLTWDSTQ